MNKQQYQSILTSFFRCEPQIGFQISPSTKRTLTCRCSNRISCQYLKKNFQRWIHACISLADSNTPKVLYSEELPLWRSQNGRHRIIQPPQRQCCHPQREDRSSQHFWSKQMSCFTLTDDIKNWSFVQSTRSEQIFR